MSCFLVLFGQEKDSIQIKLTPTFNSEALLKKQWYVSKSSDSIQLTKLKFYLTDFKILTKDGNEHSISNSNYLVDVFDEESLIINFSESHFSKNAMLSFNIGVEERMNTSGALSGDLDPSKGMFWSWQSGYINFKIEGVSPSCNTRKNKFQFHIGGYQKPYATRRSVALNLKNLNNNQITINLELSNFFETLKLNTINQVMIPGEIANILANSLPNLFNNE